MKGRHYDWEGFSDEDLLKLRLCDLNLTLKDSPIEPLIERVERELRGRGIRFRPHYWISAEWFTPDGIPGIAIPFHLVHPRLTALDRKQMQGTVTETMDFTLRVLRHEAGHAIENAYSLRRDPRVREIFGSPEKRYPKSYSPQLYSRRYVRNLGQGYAQCHPDEDFAETFAIWLLPRARWHRTYRDWPAMEKLRAMDSLMEELVGLRPFVGNQRVVDPLSSLPTTLGAHYRRLRRHFRLESPEVDRRLKSVFRESAAPRATMTADAFLRKIKPRLSRKVSELSGEPRHRVDRVLDEMISRSRHLQLKVSPRRLPTKDGLPSALTHQAVRFLRAGFYRIAV